ncbi:GatB/YqeY domain-containing protein [Miniphocaeibacter massiliensis]|uniref:GatB/YqeY domain-containing protein n=1 Tax=Miniphocaeibacter massiliensis TaxID=2041841 RepID=UPI000C0707AD|nr:GatB/YqeY domain-containing protein [Miniphocaeibacter massiliensis]
MTFLENLRKDKMKAMKDKDRDKVNVITLLMSSISLAEKEEKKTLTDEEAIVFVQKELKQAKDTLESTPKNREDIIKETNRRIEIIESYMPEQMSEDELEKEIKNLANDKNLELGIKSKGILIKETLEKFKGKTDGKTINKIIDKILK